MKLTVCISVKAIQKEFDNIIDVARLRRVLLDD